MQKPKIEGHYFENIELHKYVNVSRNGHGMVTYRMHSFRAIRTPLTVVNRFGGEEGPSGNHKIPGLKTMYRNYWKNGLLAFIEGNAFRIKPYGYNVSKPVWNDISNKGDGLGFSLNINKTFRDNYYAQYTWMWSRKNMFDPEWKDKTYFTKVKITYPTKKLYYQIAMGGSITLKEDPLLIKISPSGTETVIKKLHRKPMPDEDFGQYEVNEEDLICNYYWFVIREPELLATYRVIWKASDEVRKMV